MYDGSLEKLAAAAKAKELRQARLAVAKHEVAAARAGARADNLARRIAILRLKIRQGERRLARLYQARAEVYRPVYMQGID